MTKPNYSHVVLLLDRSGSMEVVRDSTISSVNEFVNQQKMEKGECTFTLLQFDAFFMEDNKSGPHILESTYDGAIESAPALTRKTYAPRGGTPLIDAIALTIAKTGDRLAKMPEDQRPSKVIIVIQTDGEENVSKMHTFSEVRSMIEHQKSVYNWTFIFLGADQDAIASAAKYGIPAATSISYSNRVPGSDKAAFNLASNAVSNARSGLDASFTDEDRKAALSGESTTSTPVP